LQENGDVGCITLFANICCCVSYRAERFISNHNQQFFGVVLVGLESLLTELTIHLWELKQAYIACTFTPVVKASQIRQNLDHHLSTTMASFYHGAHSA
jgi:hypothetical protein